MEVTFHGVRGSTPCEGPQYARYGGHSSCVSVEVDGEEPIIFDLGTGLRAMGDQVCARAGAQPFVGHVLLTHLHWDHVQGLPFFTPLHHRGSRLTVHGPRQEGASLAAVFGDLMRPPFFPIRPEQLDGDVRFVDVGDDDFALGSVKVRARWVRHVGPTLGFRVERDGASVAYISDHGTGCGAACGGALDAVHTGDDYVPDEVLELADGVDLLIHDAQHTREEYVPKRHWGHCTVDYAVHVAREAGARCLALFHHDPSHGDEMIDRITRRAEGLAASIGVPDLISAREGLRVRVGRRR